MPLFACLVALLLTALAALAHAEPTQITIAQPAEATTMDPGRSTQVLTVNYFYNLYDALTRWDNSLRLQPGLATSWRRERGQQHADDGGEELHRSSSFRGCASIARRRDR